MSRNKFISVPLFLTILCLSTQVNAQQKSKVIFHFSNGYIYGKNDSLNASGTITVSKNNLSFISTDRVSGKKSNDPPLAITKVEHNTKDDLGFFADKPENVLKLNNCKEVLHITTADGTDFLFAYNEGHTYLIYHNNFILVRFFISSGDYEGLKSLFSGK